MFRVLIVDDDAASGELLSARLRFERVNKQAVFETEVTTTPEAARQAVQNAGQPFDVFLLDVDLHAEVDGIALMQELRQQSPDSDAIVFTGDAEAESGQRAVELGAYRYLAMPYDVRDLIWNLRTLEQHRRVRRERDWLRVLSEIADRTQSVGSVREVAHELVKGGQRLGFERARVWRMSADKARLEGVCQAGSPELEPFTDQSIEVNNSQYAQYSLATSDASFFMGAVFGPLDVEKRMPGVFSPPTGEWAQIPLRSGGEVFAMLSLDNAEQARVLSSEEKKLLQLFGQHAAVALSRAQLFELEQKKSRDLEVLNEIGKRITSRAAEDVDELLWEVRTQLALLVDVTNFIAVLYDDELQMLDFRLQVEQGRKRARHWATPDTGLIGRVVATNIPLYFPQGTGTYRKRHNIRLVGRRSKSWLGVPLRVANQAIGALAVQSYTKRNAFSQEDLQLLTKVADMVAGAIQSAWVREREQEAAQRLAVLQQFGAEFMQLAELSDAMLWHALCTAATADYALRFNRVAVFTRRQGSLDLTGRMGIGQFEARQAYQAWEREKKREFNLKQYFADLRSGRLSATPVEQVVASMLLNVDFEGSVIKEVLVSGKRQTVARQIVERGLPAAFVAPFGITEYAVVPIRAGRDVLGILLVDNAHNAKPLSPSALEDLENTAALAVLISENVRQRHIRDSVVRANYEIIGQAANRTLHDTLLEVCKAAQEVTTADNVVIYPLLPGKGQDVYDTRAVAATGLLEPLNAGSKVRLRGVTSYVLRSGIFPVPDVAKPEHMFNNRPMAEHKFLKREKVRAFIGNRIKDPVTNEALGAIYLNYRRPRAFTKRELEVAEMFGNLSATVIRTAHQAEAARSNLQVAEISREASRRELITLRGILEESLDPDTDERKLIRSVLQGARDLLDKPDLEIHLVLRVWDQPANQEDDPKEVGLLHYIDATGAMITRAEPDISSDSHGAGLHGDAHHQVTNTQETAITLPSNGTAHTVHAAVDVPVPSGRRVIGMIRAGSSSLAALDESDAARLDRLAKVIALALDNVRRQAHLRTLLEAAQAMTTPTSLEETFEAINATARVISPNVSRVTIWHRDLISEETWLDAQFEAAGMKIGRQRRLPPEGGVRSVLRRGEPLWANDAASEPLLGEQFQTRHGVRSCAALPLLVGTEGVGVIFLNYRQRHEFSSEEKLLYPLLAEIAGASLRHAALLQLANQERERLKHSLEITAAVGSTLDLHRTLEIILAKLKELFPFATPSVLLFNEDERTLEVAPASQQYFRVDNPEFIGRFQLPVGGKGLSAQVARQALTTGEPVLENVVDVGHVGDDYLPFVLTSRSQLSAALMSDRTLLGVLMLESDASEAFTADDELLITGVAHQISLAIDRANQSTLLRFRATVTSRTSWAAEIVHDIYREIGYIRNRSYWISQVPGATNQIKRWAEEIDSSADLLASTVRGAIASERQEKQRFELAPTIDRWLTEIIRSKLPEIEVIFEHYCAGLMVEVDYDMLRRAVNHILRNAIEAMQRKGTINCSLRRVDTQRVEILLTDTGPGIPEEIRSRLGREPLTTKGEQHRGYGMIFVRSVVEGAGGKIRVLTPRDSHGAVFSISLPLAEEAMLRKE